MRDGLFYGGMTLKKSVKQFFQLRFGIRPGLIAQGAGSRFQLRPVAVNRLGRLLLCTGRGTDGRCAAGGLLLLPWLWHCWRPCLALSLTALAVCCCAVVAALMVAALLTACLALSLTAFGGLLLRRGCGAAGGSVWRCRSPPWRFVAAPWSRHCWRRRCWWSVWRCHPPPWRFVAASWWRRCWQLAWRCRSLPWRPVWRCRSPPWSLCCCAVVAALLAACLALSLAALLACCCAGGCGTDGRLRCWQPVWRCRSPPWRFAAGAVVAALMVVALLAACLPSRSPPWSLVAAPWLRHCRSPVWRSRTGLAGALLQSPIMVLQQRTASAREPLTGTGQGRGGRVAWDCQPCMALGQVGWRPPGFP